MKTEGDQQKQGNERGEEGVMGSEYSQNELFMKFHNESHM